MKKSLIAAYEELIEKYHNPFDEDGDLKEFFVSEKCPICKAVNSLCRKCPNRPRNNEEATCGSFPSVKDAYECYEDYRTTHNENDKVTMIKSFNIRAAVLARSLSRLKKQKGR